MEGLSVEVAELIAMASQAQKVRYASQTYALRAGAHHSKVRGRGMDFSEARNYQAGDEIRHMEWRMTARTGRPHVKVYHEERERPVLILVDFNPSMFFGTRIAYKSVIAARLAAILAWTAAHQGDRVGGLLFSATQHQVFTPKTRQVGILPFLSGLSHYSQQPPQAAEKSQEAFAHALLRIQRLVKPGSIVVLISDFYAFTEQHARLFKRLRVHNDLLAYHICDRLELMPPAPGLYGISDGQEVITMDTRLDLVRVGYQTHFEKKQMHLQQQLKQSAMQYTQVTAESALGLLVKQTFPQRVGG